MHFSEESPRSPKRQPVQNNFSGLGDLPSLNPTTPKEDGFLSAREDKSVNDGAGHISEAYEDDFGSSANSINLPNSHNKSKSGAAGLHCISFELHQTKASINVMPMIIEAWKINQPLFRQNNCT